LQWSAVTARPRRPRRLSPRRRGGAIEVGGHGLSSSKKWRDPRANPRVAFVVDDLKNVGPWTPRGIEVRGRAELHDEGGESFSSGWDSAWIRILPHRIVSWGIEWSAFSAAGRSRPLGRQAMNRERGAAVWRELT
jgi:PPOX class F420-dependent enzyme/OxyR family protein